MGTTQFLTRRLQHVGTEMSLYVLAYNVKRSMTIFSVKPMLQAMRA